MPFMLIKTHATLLQAIRDAHATELTLERQRAQDAQSALLKLHQAEHDLFQARLSFAQEKLGAAEKLNQAFVAEKLALVSTIRSQQDTLRSAMQDLVILKGAGRVRTETGKQAEGQGIPPDVEITDEMSDVPSRKRLLQEAEQEYERVIAGLDTSKVTGEALAAAIPASADDWREEHAAPETDVSPIPGAALFRD